MIELRLALALAAMVMNAACSPSARDGQRPVPEWVHSMRLSVGSGEVEAVDAELERRARAPADDYFALCLRAEIHVKRADFEAAAKDLQRALEREPADAPRDWRAWLRYELGFLTFHFVGTPEEALGFYGAALEIDPLHYKALEHRGFVHAELSNMQAAVADWRRALECWPPGLAEAERAQIAQWLVAGLSRLGLPAQAAAVERDELARRRGAAPSG